MKSETSPFAGSSGKRTTRISLATPLSAAPTTCLVLLALLVIVAENEDAPVLEVWRQLRPPFPFAAVIAGGGESKRAEIIDVLLAASDQDRSIAALYQLGQPIGHELGGRELAGLGAGRGSSLTQNEDATILEVWS